MKIYGKITRISDLIEIPGKEGKESTGKKVVCIEEINPDKEVLDRIAIDFMGQQKIELLNGIGEGDICYINFSIVYNAYEDKFYNSVRGRKILRESGGTHPVEKEKDQLPF